MQINNENPMWFHRRGASSVVCGIIAMMTSATFAQNLISGANPGFETGNMSNWTATAGICSVTTAQKRSGLYAGLAANRTQVYHGFGRQNLAYMTSNKIYRFASYIKLANTASTSVESVLKVTRDGVTTWTSLGLTACDNVNWTKTEGHYQLGDLTGVTEVQVYYKIADTSVSYYVDDAELVEVLGLPVNFTIRALNEWEDTNQSGLAVTAVDQTLNDTYTGTTNASGLFTFNGQPGPYVVTITRNGTSYNYGVTVGDGLTRETFIVPDYRAKWSFNDSASPGLDEGPGGLNLTLSSGVWLDGKRRVGVAQFNGTSQNGVAPTAIQDGFTNYSVSLWFKANATSGTYELYEQGTSLVGLALRIRANLLETCVRNSSKKQATISTPFTDTTSWHHVVVTFSSTGAFKLYLDGVEKATTTASFTSVPSHTSGAVGLAWRNGQDVFGASTANYFNGKLDDVRIYKSVLTPAQIAFVADQVRCISAMYCRRWGILNLPISHFGHSSELLYSFIRPNTDGSLYLYSNLGNVDPFDQSVKTRLAAIRTAYPNLKMVIAVAGSETEFGPMCASSTARQAFISNLIAFCQAEGFQGINFDYEYPQTTTEKADYLTLLTEAKPAFAAQGLTLTQAFSIWNVQNELAYSTVDGNYLMAYDFNWGENGSHNSSYDDTVYALRQAISLPGMLRSKLALGVPFYGNKWVNDIHYSTTYSYILDTYNPAPGDDWAADWAFNGQTTIANKTNLATSCGLRGVMAWDLQCDTTTQPTRSLVITIKDRAAEP